jgi:hypothetical protein
MRPPLHSLLSCPCHCTCTSNFLAKGMPPAPMPLAPPEKARAAAPFHFDKTTIFNRPLEQPSGVGLPQQIHSSANALALATSYARLLSALTPSNERWISQLRLGWKRRENEIARGIAGESKDMSGVAGACAWVQYLCCTGNSSLHHFSFFA